MRRFWARRRQACYIPTRKGTIMSPVMKDRRKSGQLVDGAADGGPCGHGDERRFFCVSSASRCQ
jgi:hypothetical protein